MLSAAPRLSNLPCLTCWSLLSFYRTVFPLLEKKQQAEEKDPVEHLEGASRGDVRPGHLDSSRRAEPAAVAARGDTGLCLQPGPEALDVAAEKSAVRF